MSAQRGEQITVDRAKLAAVVADVTRCMADPEWVTLAPGAARRARDRIAAILAKPRELGERPDDEPRCPGCGERIVCEDCDSAEDICPDCWICVRCSIDGHDEGCGRGAMDRREPVAYLVAERRGGRWVIGDDWNHRCEDLAEARDVAHQWRSFDRTDPADIGVLAVTVVPADDDPSGGAR